MSEILGGLILGIIVLVIGLFIEYKTGFFASRRNKKISYQILSVTPLVTVSRGFSSRISILLDEEPVRDISLITINIHNSGNEEITTSNFEMPLRLTISEGNFVESQITERKPEDITVVISRENERELRIEPLLLNVGDSITISLLIENYRRPGLKVEGRIAGTSIEGVNLHKEPGGPRHLEAILKVALWFIISGVVIAIAADFILKVVRASGVSDGMQVTAMIGVIVLGLLSIRGIWAFLEERYLKDFR